MNNTIRCPHCKKIVEISEALRHEFEASNRKELEKAKKEAVEIATKKAIEETEFKLKNTKNENEEIKKQNKELRDQLLVLNRTVRGLNDKLEKTDLEIQKKVNEEVKKAKEGIYKDEKEKFHLENAELKKQLEDTKKALTEAQRKAQQSSQQLQGEVLELDLEQRLNDAFRNDDVEEVKKGAEGGDIIQKVKNSYGKQAGIILWEAKRAKWRPSWLPKLREDGRKAGASVSVLVSEQLPRDIVNFGFVDNVLITSYQFAIALAVILRRGIIQVAVAKSTTVNKDERLEKLYSYLQSETFRHRFEAYVEGVVGMQQDLETEKRSAQRLWKKREIQISKTLENISNMYGELQGVMGSSLPDIKILSLESGWDDSGKAD